MTNAVTSADAVYAALPTFVLVLNTLDDEPALTLPSGVLRYGIGQLGVGLDGRARISDPNTPNYNDVTLTVAITTNATADDRLEIRHTGNGPGQIGLSSSTVSYSGVPIATFSGGVGTAPLLVTFNNAANAQAAQALLRSVTFRNVSANPSRNSRSVSVVLAHTDGGQGRAQTGVHISLVRVADFHEGADSGYGVYTGAADTSCIKPSPPHRYWRATPPTPTIPRCGSTIATRTIPTRAKCSCALTTSSATAQARFRPTPSSFMPNCS